jgi:nucleotide-binding universal stress UspA family protein
VAGSDARAIDAAVGIARDARATDVVPVAIEGDVAAALCDSAVSERADLLVVATRGEGGARGLGTVANAVSHRAPCDLLLVAGG